jgi:hypothetical protein
MEIKVFSGFERFVGMSPLTHEYLLILDIPTSEM